MIGKKALMIVGLVLAVVILGVPAISYSSATNDPDTMVMTLDVEVTCEGYLMTPDWIYSTSFDDQLRGGYLGYVGDFWGDVMSVGSTVVEYPLLHVLMQVGSDIATREVWTKAYTYGDELHFSCEYIAHHGDLLKVQIQLYYAQSVSSPTSWDEIVP